MEDKVEDIYRGMFVVTLLHHADGSVTNRAVCRPTKVTVETVNAGIAYRLLHYSIIYWPEQPTEEDLSKGRMYLAPATREDKLRYGDRAPVREKFSVRILRNDYPLEQIEALIIEDFLENIANPGAKTTTMTPTSSSMRVQKNRIFRVGDIGIMDAYHLLELENPTCGNLEVKTNELSFRVATYYAGKSIEHLPKNAKERFTVQMDIDCKVDVHATCAKLFRDSQP